MNAFKRSAGNDISRGGEKSCCYFGTARLFPLLRAPKNTCCVGSLLPFGCNAAPYSSGLSRCPVGNIDIDSGRCLRNDIDDRLTWTGS
jgi:hypothetical protein